MRARIVEGPSRHLLIWRTLPCSWVELLTHVALSILELLELVVWVAIAAPKHVWWDHLWVSLWQELEEGSQSVLVGEEVLDGVWVLGDKGGLHEAVFLVLDELSEVDH